MGSFKDGVLLERVTTQAAASGTLSLTVTSTTYQRFTGSTSGQIVQLPAATTLTVGQKYVIQNRATAPITVNDGSGSLLYLVPSGQDRTFQCYANGTTAGTWDTSNSANSGGGGGSLQWIEDGNSPTPGLDAAENRIYNFDNGAGQLLYAAIKVPKSYSVGDQIFLLLPFYSPDSSGTALMQTVSTLIRPGTDTFSSTTNQRTSTNSAISLGAGTVNIPQMVSFDLTDSSGNINGVPVAASNVIYIALTRGTDTGASDLSVMVYAAEVTF